MSKRVKYEFNPFTLAGRRPKTDAQRKRVYREVKDYVLEQVLDDVARTKSPVTGRQFARLSEAYRERKGEEARAIPNLELSGDMLDSLRVERKGDKLVLTVGASQNDKADNHNKFSAKSKKTSVPRRQFVPNKEMGNGTFRPGIVNEITRIVEEELDGSGRDKDQD